MRYQNKYNDNDYVREIPVFRPSKEEFEDFEGYMKKIEQDEKSSKLGLVKVIPPLGWSWTSKPNVYEQIENKERIIKPIKQHISGKKGSYQLNIADSKKRTIREFEQLAKKYKKTRPFARFLEANCDDAYEMNGTIVESETYLEWNETSEDSDTTDPSSQGFSYRFDPIPSTKDAYHVTGHFQDPHKTKSALITDCFDLYIIRDSMVNDKDFHVSFVEGVGTNAIGRNRMSGFWDRKLNTLMLVRVYTEEEPFDLDTLRVASEKNEFLDLETAFWELMSANVLPPLYGGDQCGTMFTHEAGSWNLNELDTILRVGFHNRQAKGITTSMLYVGMWRAIFAWHTEDMELNSINYLHYGAPKIWYAIPPEYAKKFETLCKVEFGDSANRCKEFIRHKNLMVSPLALQKARIPYVRAIHYEGEFIVTFPRSYHAGFNTGFNIAEAVNFATERWIDIGRKSKWCKCEDWTFRIDMDRFTETLRHFAPQRINSNVSEGVRILVGYKANENEPPVYYMCRVKKNFRTGELTLAPIDKNNCAFEERAFDPDSDSWMWPPPDPQDIQPAPPCRARSMNGRSMKAQSKKKGKAFLIKDAPSEATDKSIMKMVSIVNTRMEKKRKKLFDKLHQTRQKRRMQRKMRHFEHIQANPITLPESHLHVLNYLRALQLPEIHKVHLFNIVIHQREPLALLQHLKFAPIAFYRESNPMQVQKPKPTISCKKMALLQHLANTRAERRAIRKRHVSLKVSSAVSHLS